MESEDSQPQTTDTATVQTTKAAEPTLLASWDFTGKNGTTNSAIADSTGKYNLTLKDGAKIEQYGDRSNNEALSLRGDGQYAQIDDQLFKDAGDSFTLEFASKTRHDDSGKFFSFIVGKDGSNDANTTDQANANKYLMFYNSKTAIKGVISNNNWGNEQGSKVTVSGNDNSWADYKIVVDGTNLAVFRNNALIIFKANTGIKMSDLGATTAYIGKSFYSVDEYWNGAMDDIKVYRGADLTMPTAVAISGTGVVNNKLTLIEKDSTKLTATVTPDDAVSKNVTWSSSDESVAKVAADGTVTGVKAGTATITATCGDVSASATVKVVNSGVDRQSIDLNTSYVVLKPGASRTITGKVTPSSASQSLTFKSNDTKVATVSAKGVITAVGTGATSIVVSNGTASASVTVIVNRNASSSGNGGGSTDDSNGEVVTDPVVEAIEADGTDEVTFAQRDVPTITGEMLNALRLNGKTLVVEADNYTIRIAGRDVKSTSAQVSTALSFAPSEYGVTFTLNGGEALPGVVQVEMTGDNAAYTRVYLHNAVKGKWQFLNSYKDNVLEADTAGEYLLTTQNLRFAHVDMTFFIAGLVVIVGIIIAYIVIKKRYWFW